MAQFNSRCEHLSFPNIPRGGVLTDMDERFEQLEPIFNSQELESNMSLMFNSEDPLFSGPLFVALYASIYIKSTPSGKRNLDSNDESQNTIVRLFFRRNTDSSGYSSSNLSAFEIVLIVLGTFPFNKLLKQAF